MSAHNHHNECPECGGKKDTRSKRCIQCHGKWMSETGVALMNRRTAAKPDGSRILEKNGYVLLRVNGKWVREHRYIMEQHLGRSLLRTEQVHHKNGQKEDNSLSNLELWSNSQPTGARVEDLLIWAREIITLYG